MLNVQVNNVNKLINIIEDANFADAVVKLDAAAKLELIEKLMEMTAAEIDAYYESLYD